MSTVTPSKDAHSASPTGPQPPERIALKEWSIVIEAISRGEQTILLRKGGVIEPGGEFHPKHETFFLYPTFEHQKSEFLRQPFRDRLHPPPAVESKKLTINHWAQVTDTAVVKDTATLTSLSRFHVLTEPYAEQRFRYGGEDRPLYMLLIRAYAIVPHQNIPVKTAYAGCTSWVPLERKISVGRSIPVLNDETFAALRTRITNTVRSS